MIRDEVLNKLSEHTYFSEDLGISFIDANMVNAIFEEIFDYFEAKQKPLKPKKKTEIIQNDSSHFLANFLYNKIANLNPKFKEPNLKIWAKDIDKAMRIDSRTFDDLKECIDWIYSPNGSFWQPNILSGKKLREKYDTISMQMKRPQQRSWTDNNVDVANSWLDENDFHEMCKPKVIGG